VGKLPNPFVRLTIDLTLVPTVAVVETLDMEVEQQETFKNRKGKPKKSTSVKSPPTKESKASENEACSEDDLFSPIL
jgi:hypothetical protein